MSTPHITSTAVKERKVSQSASCKIDSIIRQLFLPMLSMPTPERTSFLAEDAEDQLLRQVAQERPGILATETEFVDYMVILYRKFQRESHASDSVSFGMTERKQSVSTADEVAVDSCDSHYESCNDFFDSDGNNAGQNYDSIEEIATGTATAASTNVSEVPFSGPDDLKNVSKPTSKSVSKRNYSKSRIEIKGQSKSRSGPSSGQRARNQKQTYSQGV
jgi:hypothetical protein